MFDHIVTICFVNKLGRNLTLAKHPELAWTRINAAVADDDHHDLDEAFVTASDKRLRRRKDKNKIHLPWFS